MAYCCSNYHIHSSPFQSAGNIRSCYSENRCVPPLQFCQLWPFDVYTNWCSQRCCSQLPEHDMAWLESWAKAVVHASTTDQKERLHARTASPGATKSSDGDDASQGREGFQGSISERGIRARRRAMKVAVRERYAFSATARLWAEEMTSREGKRSRTGSG